ncbi:MAG TPA: FAD-dependent oxidoreductase [Pirellulales bacterium]|jgi:2-polyprenyl-6-methoxyphenol hydroxylase-like FAD-dependent oxidoreductase|nr:FAD-dependent oxidoreductase [Pirellulales bacterium]
MIAADAATEHVETGCCIVGGGPAGMMLGYLLARAGVDVMVLEKHADFLRDFRGDTVHPSTLEVIYELGLLDDFLQRPHQEVQELHGFVGKFETIVADFRFLPTQCKFIALMPQWDFLNFLAEHARGFPTFHLRMQADAKELIEADDRVVGIRAQTPAGSLEVRAGLTVGCDGRHSIIRQRAGLTVREYGSAIDVLWMRISRHADDPFVPLGRFNNGQIFVMLYRDQYWQCAYVIPKGGYDEIRQRGLEAFRQQILEISPFLGERVNELRSWDDIRLLTVKVDRLERWYRPGLLCIGDAAHAMSPIGGVGINMAIQDAVAAANLLAQPLREKALKNIDLHRVQRRREFPTWVTQRAQVFVQDRVMSRALSAQQALKPPRIVRWLRRWPRLRRIPARLVGLGVRPEHVHTPDAFA